MSYRDDNDAAQARADALQVDLDQTREALAAAEAKLAAREAALAESEGLNTLLEARAEAEARKRAKGKRGKTEKQRINPNWYPLAGILAIPTLCLVFYVVSGDRVSDRERARNERDRDRRLAGTLRDSLHSPTTCTIDTIPKGATLTIIGPGRAFRTLGTTPTFVPLATWGRDIYVEASLPGYEPMKIFTVLATGNSCHETYTLTRAVR